MITDYIFPLGLVNNQGNLYLQIHIASPTLLVAFSAHRPQWKMVSRVNDPQGISETI